MSGWELVFDGHGKAAWAYNGLRFGRCTAEQAQIPYDPECVEHLLREEGVAPFDVNKNPNSGDKLYRLLCKNSKAAPTSARASRNSPNNKDDVESCARRAIEYYETLQDEKSGCWPGDYGGPLFLMPGLIITCYVTKTPIPEPHKCEMIRYMLNHQNQDGGWGLHIEKLDSTIFGSALNYVALRLLGVSPADSPAMQRARRFLLLHGGAGGIPSWGKFWLAVAGVYEWAGVNSIFPELWIAPHALPIHPWRWWCHCRMVYLPMTYIYGHRVRAEECDLLKEIRAEIYPIAYDKINWTEYRAKVAKIDEYRGHSYILNAAFFAANFYEDYLKVGFLRRKSLEFLIDYIRAEDDQTMFVDIGPVSKAINMLCRWHADGPDSEAFKQHQLRLDDYLWLAEDGMKMQGYNGSQLWDTSFAVMSVVETGMEHSFTDMMKKAYHYIAITQVDEDVKDRERYYRHISKGGWPFSTKDHGWPIADCTAHGLEAALLIHERSGDQNRSLIPEGERIPDERIFDAVNILISCENARGGWATFEKSRGYFWLELLNPSEVFGDIMIDYSYTELTASVIRVLAIFREQYPDHRVKEVNGCIERGLEYIIKRQRIDGGWYGSWGVCFTYGTFFAIDAMVRIGVPRVSTPIRRACQFLVERQNPDGGWGESYLSAVTDKWVSHEESQVVNTAWAALALMLAEYEDHMVVDKAIKLLLQRQEENGDWPQESISGVFSRNCMITCTGYRNVFPIKALGHYMRYKNAVG
eukprot:TRINITY_DN7312_c0_g1_i5.p1 TRINITY_DN7312_c0_g1~~TRINITY_DN7312_c0_g1_i5.p1  ORF type:complete len:752 (-),score=152.30 TRINITY_DN7312_c0_g1_i5:74-2329(-)